MTNPKLKNAIQSAKEEKLPEQNPAELGKDEELDLDKLSEISGGLLDSSDTCSGMHCCTY